MRFLVGGTISRPACALHYGVHFLIRGHSPSLTHRSGPLFRNPLSRIALFLDFDGTLVRIVERPDLVVVTPEIRAVLERLNRATGGAVALLSGRPLGEIDGFLAPMVLPGAGAHGAERRDSGGVFVPAAKAEALTGAGKRIRAHAAAHGLLLEEKSGGFAVHFRVRPDLEEATRALVSAVAAQDTGLRAIHGHMVAELALAGVDKGAALDAFMGETPFAGRIPVAIGDDTTDEDAFRAAQAQGGLGIRIGGAQTRAGARFENIDVFHDWLIRSAENDMMILEIP